MNPDNNDIATIPLSDAERQEFRAELAARCRDACTDEMPTVDELIAYRAGTLPESDVDRVRRAIVAYPQLALALFRARITKEAWLAAADDFSRMEFERLGGPATPEEVAAYAAGELTEQEAARVRTLLVCDPCMSDVLLEPDELPPSDDAEMEARS